MAVTPCGLEDMHQRFGGVFYPGVANSRFLQNVDTPWPLVRERTIPTERPPLVDEI
jgi:hypothetical protein